MATLKPEPFKVHFPESDLQDLKTLIKLGRLPPATFEGQDAKYGITDEWMKTTKQYWLESFDWRKHEARINSIPNFKVPLTDDDGTEYSIHFLHAKSSKPNAIPLLLLHGWPGSILEFLDVIPILTASDAPAFEIIAPSLPGFAFSSSSPKVDLKVVDVARLMDKLMVGLGYGKGYIIQGGDIGSIVGRVISVDSPSCKGIHMNLWGVIHPKAAELPATELEQKQLAYGGNWARTGTAYASVHATRPSTMGHVIASNPLALLAWIGEKFLAWSDVDPSIDTILEAITLYWLTETFPRSIYPYRNLVFHPDADDPLANPKYMKLTKPFGYSWFPKEQAAAPKSWMEDSGDLVFFKHHEAGGHFAALENPKLLTEDFIEYATYLTKNNVV